MIDKNNIIDATGLDDWGVIDKYKELYGALNFDKVGVVYIGGLPFYIVKDEINGKLIYKGTTYRVARTKGDI